MKRRDFIAKGGIVGAGIVGVAALSGCEDKKEVAAPAVVADRVKLPWCQHGRVTSQALALVRRCTGFQVCRRPYSGYLLCWWCWCV